MTTPAHRTGRTALTYEELSAEQKLRAFWNDFCQCDFYHEDFADDMEKSGFVELRTATQRDVDSIMFASELGIVVGEPMYELTDAGRAALSASRSTGDQS